MPRRSAEAIDPRTLEAFEKQMTRTVAARAIEYGKRRAQMLRAAGCAAAEDEGEILVNDAVADTLTGVVIWDHERQELGAHLRDVIRTRTWNQMKRARRLGHVSLDDDDSESASHGVATASMAGEHAPDRPDDVVSDRDVIAKFFVALADRAAGDADVLALLDPYREGVVERRDVIEGSGISAVAFVNARRRLDRMLADMPDELRAESLAAMRKVR